MDPPDSAVVRVAVDYQLLFNISTGLVAFLMGWVLNSIAASVKALALEVKQVSTEHRTEMQRLDQEHRRTREEYVAKVDYKEDLHEISRRFDKLDDKLDKVLVGIGHGSSGG